MNLVDFRCTKCNKLLGKINGIAEIKCPRCNSHNRMTSVSSNHGKSNLVIATPSR